VAQERHAAPQHTAAEKSAAAEASIHRAHLSLARCGRMVEKPGL
jgi:hypothetical protein